MKKFLIALALIPLFASCEMLEDVIGGEEEAPVNDVQNSYVPVEGKQVKQILQVKGTTKKVFDFTYDDLGRIKKAVWTQTTDIGSSDEKTINEEYKYSYKETSIVVNKNQFTLNLNDDGRVSEVVKSSTTGMVFDYDGIGRLQSCTYTQGSLSYGFNVNWSQGNMVSTTGDVAMTNNRTFTSYPNKTNIDIAALITNGWWVFETWLSGSSRIPFGTFGFLGRINEHLPASELYNTTSCTYSYDFDSDGCPTKISTSDGWGYMVYYY